MSIKIDDRFRYTQTEYYFEDWLVIDKHNSMKQITPGLLLGPNNNKSNNIGLIIKLSEPYQSNKIIENNNNILYIDFIIQEILDNKFKENESIDKFNIMFLFFDRVFKRYNETIKNNKIVLIDSSNNREKSYLILQSILLNIQIKNLECPDIEGNLNYLNKLHKDNYWDYQDYKIYLEKYLNYKCLGIYGF